MCIAFRVGNAYAGVEPWGFRCHLYVWLVALKVAQQLD